ncbi:hypothetical protein FRC00_002808 [Tulasnella sp. 408]|nr:hypothetical protein FRC00_002808 [Tulasnella sp. 408]
MSHGDLKNYIAKAKPSLTVRDLTDGLTYLHSQSVPIRHGDLKPGNVLVNSGRRALLADFGLSKALDTGPTGFTTGNDAKCTPEPQLIYALMQGKSPSDETDYSFLPPLLVDLLAKCWSLEPNDRPTAARCLYIIDSLPSSPSPLPQQQPQISPSVTSPENGALWNELQRRYVNQVQHTQQLNQNANKMLFQAPAPHLLQDLQPNQLGTGNPLNMQQFRPSPQAAAAVAAARQNQQPGAGLNPSLLGGSAPLSSPPPLPQQQSHLSPHVASAQNAALWNELQRRYVNQVQHSLQLNQNATKMLDEAQAPHLQRGLQPNQLGNGKPLNMQQFRLNPQAAAAAAAARQNQQPGAGLNPRQTPYPPPPNQGPPPPHPQQVPQHYPPQPLHQPQPQPYHYRIPGQDPSSPRLLGGGAPTGANSNPYNLATGEGPPHMSNRLASPSRTKPNTYILGSGPNALLQPLQQSGISDMPDLRPANGADANGGGAGGPVEALENQDQLQYLHPEIERLATVEVKLQQQDSLQQQQPQRPQQPDPNARGPTSDQMGRSLPLGWPTNIIPLMAAPAAAAQQQQQPTPASTHSTWVSRTLQAPPQAPGQPLSKQANPAGVSHRTAAERSSLKREAEDDAADHKGSTSLSSSPKRARKTERRL